MKNMIKRSRIKTIIPIVVIIAIVFSIEFFYNNIQKQYDEYLVVENEANPQNMQKRIVVLENCESGEKITKEVLNRTTYAILYQEGKIVEMRK